MSPNHYFKAAHPLCLKTEFFSFSRFLSAIRLVKVLVSVSALGTKWFQTKGTGASAFVSRTWYLCNLKKKIQETARIVTSRKYYDTACHLRTILNPLMDVTKLFEIGHLSYKIVEFPKFSMKQVCKPKKKAILPLTLNPNIYPNIYLWNLRSISWPQAKA